MSEERISEMSQYLTFTLGDEAFALEISRVREVVDYVSVTKVPRMPAYLCGVINLRGNVVSVIDLRLKLGMSATVKTGDTCIVIAEVSMDGKILPMGLLADSVQEVIYFDSDQIEPPPKVGTKLNPEFIRAIGKRNDSFVIILNIDKLLSKYESMTISKDREISEA
ncbi:chemotaxis protein CheW [Desulfobacterales bacterium HSG2]|nr:chemotaxis protein CheW [Desulfobacterales bacterium HSG2]